MENRRKKAGSTISASSKLLYAQYGIELTLLSSVGDSLLYSAIFVPKDQSRPKCPSPS